MLPFHLCYLGGKWENLTLYPKDIIIKMLTLVIRPKLSTVSSSSLPAHIVIYFSLYEHCDRSNNNNNMITSSCGLYNIRAVNNRKNIPLFVTLTAQTIYYIASNTSTRCVLYKNIYHTSNNIVHIIFIGNLHEANRSISRETIIYYYY